MPRSSKQNSYEEELSSDGSEYDDGRDSDEEYGNSGESDGDYSDDGGSKSGSESESESDYDPEEYNDEEVPESGRNPRFVVTERYADDDEDGETTKNNDEWWEGREAIIAAVLLCWCCLCLIIIGVVLGVVLGGRNNKEAFPDDTPMIPTDRPTFAPQPLPPSQMTSAPSESMAPTLVVTLSPTLKPTSRPTVPPTNSFHPTISIPERLEVIADQDTYVAYNVSKEFVGDEYGFRDTFLVQKVPLKDELLADTVGLISFPMEDVPVFSRVKDMKFSAVLRLTHELNVKDDEEDEEEDDVPPAYYTIVRIPETKTKMEFWHGFYFVPPEDDDEGVLVGPNFTVTPSQSIVQIPIESLLYNYELIENKKPKKMFLMIENRGPDQVNGGDRFYSRESDTPPTLVMNFVTDD